MPTIAESLQTALVHHQAGRFKEAEPLYRQILQTNPQHADAWHLLGLLAHSVGQQQAAYEYIRKAVGLNPKASIYYNNLGLVCRSIKHDDEAETCYRQALELQADYAAAHNNLAVLMQSRGRLQEAEQSYRAALQIEPNLPAALSNLASVLKDLDQLDEAQRCGEQALKISPKFVDAHINLGTVLLRLGKKEEAERHYRQATEIDPRSAMAFNNLGALYQGNRQLERAAECFAKALQIEPKSVSSLFNLGQVYRDLMQLKAAEELYRRVLAIDPKHDEARSQLAFILKDSGKYREAREHLAALSATGKYPGSHVKAALTLPVILESHEEMYAERERLLREVTTIAHSGLRLANPLGDVGMVVFFLAYHGCDDRPLQEAISHMMRQIAPSLDYVAPHCRPDAPRAERKRIRIGFVSRFLHWHSVGKVVAGLIKHLAREKFEVLVFRIPGIKDHLSDAIDASADRLITLSTQLDAARQTISDAELDILFYTDVGMDPWTYLLAQSRLAPVQCVTGGHPVTTGIPNMDYFLSADVLEPADGEAHYTERLVRLNRLAVYYERPQVTQPLPPRSQFGLPEDRHLYVCPQSLFKVHPDFDPILLKLLESDDLAQIVFFGGLHQHWEEILKARFARTLGPLSSRVTWLPRMNYVAFLEVMALADAILDTPCFNGGTTSLDALALGAPIVTLPGPFMRGRQTLSAYRQLGVLDCIAQDADDYVRLAIRLATDRPWREEVRARILANQAKIFENPEALEELEQFFEQAMSEIGSRPA